jgi:hypothetical protein
MNSASTVFVAAPTELTLTLCWIDDLFVRDRRQLDLRDSEVAHAAHENKDFSAELIKLHSLVEQGAFEEAAAALDAILEKFALAQAIAFERRAGKRV